MLYVLNVCNQFMHAKTAFNRDFIFSSMLLCHNIGMWCAYIKWFTLMFEEISVFFSYSNSRMVILNFNRCAYLVISTFHWCCSIVMQPDSFNGFFKIEKNVEMPISNVECQMFIITWCWKHLITEVLAYINDSDIKISYIAGFLNTKYMYTNIIISSRCIKSLQ